MCDSLNKNIYKCSVLLAEREWTWRNQCWQFCPLHQDPCPSQSCWLWTFSSWTSSDLQASESSPTSANVFANYLWSSPWRWWQFCPLHLARPLPKSILLVMDIQFMDIKWSSSFWEFTKCFANCLWFWSSPRLSEGWTACNLLRQWRWRKTGINLTKVLPSLGKNGSN